MDATAGGTREGLINAIVDAVNKGDLFIIGVAIIISHIGKNTPAVLAEC